MKGWAPRRLIIMPLVLLLAMAPGVANAASGYTGLVIVARVAHLDRSMSPAVLTPNGQVVYGRGWWKPGQLNADLANARGIVEYAPSTLAAKRAGPRPLVVAAIGISGPPLSTFKTDVIVSEENARRIRAANTQARFLERLQVVIVVEPPLDD